MSLRSNFARLFASLRRYRADAACRKWQWNRRRCFHPVLTRPCSGSLDESWTDSSLVSATTALSRNPRVRIREPQTIGPIDEEEEEEWMNRGFLEDVRETVLILARIVIVSSVVTTLIAAYLITRLTHTRLFPGALRSGERKIVFTKYYAAAASLSEGLREAKKQFITS